MIPTITLETAVQPKETKEAKESEGIVQSLPITLRVISALFISSSLSPFFVFFGYSTSEFRIIHGGGWHPACQ